VRLCLVRASAGARAAARAQVIDAVARLAEEHADVAMLARTHGQTASPTTLGKEMAIFAHRLARQRRQARRPRARAPRARPAAGRAVGLEQTAALEARPSPRAAQGSSRAADDACLEANVLLCNLEQRGAAAPLARE